MNSAKGPEEFSLFAMVYMATVDGSIHPAEFDALLEKAKQLFPGLDDVGQRTKGIIDDINKMGRPAADAWMEEHLQMVNGLTAEQKHSLLVLLLDIINADGRVREEETQAFKKLRASLS